MKIILFSDSFPQGNFETFLENEIPFLSKEVDKVIIIPLQRKSGLRIVPKNVECWDPILNFDLKDKRSLFKTGFFNLSPFLFYLKEFFSAKIFLSKQKIWNFFTSVLLARSLYSKRKVWKSLFELVSPNDLFYFYWGDKTALILPYLKKRIQNKTIVRFHRTDLYEYAKNNYIPFRKLVFPHINWFLPISDDGKKYLLETYPKLICENEVKVCRLGVFDNGLNPNQRSDNNIFHLVSCSYVVPVKRLSLIVESLRYTNFKIKWTHIGTGSLIDEVKKSAMQLSSDIEVELLGALNNVEVMNYYKSHHVDLFINVSASEGVPVSIMEALSFGIPVLATDVGGTPEIVDNEVGELLSPDISAVELSEKLVRFAETASENKRQNARKRWEELCSAEKNYTDFVSFLKSV